MNNEAQIPKTPDCAKQKRRRTHAVTIAVLLIASLGVLIYSALADAPVLSIKPLGTNQFSVIITNPVTTTNYTLYWTRALANSNYPWEVLGVGDVGQTNFTVNGGEWSGLFFRVLLGIDFDGDGVPEWQDAQPSNPNVGILSVTIDSPTNGFNFN